MSQTSSDARPRFRWWAFWAALLGSVPVLWLVFGADGWFVNRLVVRIWNYPASWGIPITPDQMDALLNTVMLLPAALLGALWAPLVRWWGWGLIGLVASLGIELLQHQYLVRDASWSDVFFNTLGAFLGAGLGELVNRHLSRR